MYLCDQHIGMNAELLMQLDIIYLKLAMMCTGKLLNTHIQTKLTDYCG